MSDPTTGPRESKDRQPPASWVAEARRSRMDDWNQAEYVSRCLLTIEATVRAIEDECSDYGGWAGEDDAAKVAVDLCQRLMGLAWVVAIHGREAAESGEM